MEKIETPKPSASFLTERYSKLIGIPYQGFSYELVCRPQDSLESLMVVCELFVAEVKRLQADQKVIAEAEETAKEEAAPEVEKEDEEIKEEEA